MSHRLVSEHKRDQPVPIVSEVGEQSFVHLREKYFHKQSSVHSVSFPLKNGHTFIETQSSKERKVESDE